MGVRFVLDGAATLNKDDILTQRVAGIMGRTLAPLAQVAVKAGRMDTGHWLEIVGAAARVAITAAAAHITHKTVISPREVRVSR